MPQTPCRRRPRAVPPGLALLVLLVAAVTLAPAGTLVAYGETPAGTTLDSDALDSATPNSATPANDTAASEEAGGGETPPMAERDAETRELHGVTMVDPYPYLKDREDPRTIPYLEAENAYTEAMTEHLDALEEELFQEMKGRIQETDLSVPVEHGGWLYYQRTEEGKQYPVYARKRSEDAPEQVILDVNELAEGHAFFRVGVYKVSPDHKLVAWSFDTVGDEDYVLRVKDLESGEMLPDAIPNTSRSVAWASDNRTLFYNVRDAAKRPHKIFRHRLGTDPADDVLVYHEPDEAFFAGVERTRDGEYLLFGSGSATTSETSFLAADDPEGEPRVVLPREHEVEYRVGHHGGHFYLVTNQGGATNFKVVRAPAGSYPAGSLEDSSQAEIGPWEVVIPHREEATVEAIDLFADFMVVREREAGLRHLEMRPLGDESPVAEAHRVEFPENPYAVWPGSNPEFDGDRYRLTYMSLTTPRSVYDYHPAERELELRKRTPVLGGYDPADYESVRLYARASDGVAVPVDLVYRRGVELDGDNPTLLYGYGSYGASLDPFFSSTRVSLLDRGFVFAIAHPRGGGELGEAWHEAGRMLDKRNTFTDFVAVAEFLVDAGYTRPELLAAQGGSAGGLLMGAVVNLRPDLFDTVVANVPFVDVMNTMLDPSIPLTVIEYEEWGNPNQAEYFHYMRSYSPYDNVAEAEYPAMLITAGLNDTRVGYWEPAKWTAKLRTMKQGDEPLLLKTNMGAGHGGASGRYDALRETAFEYAFVLDQVGDGADEKSSAAAEAGR